MASQRPCARSYGVSTHPWRVACAFYTVPDGAAYGAHGESAAEVVKDDPRAALRD